MTLRDMDLDTALAISAARQPHAVHVGARRAGAGRGPGPQWASSQAGQAIPAIH